MEMKKVDGRKNNGGKRAGSGQPKKEPTVVISFRVLEKNAPELKTRIEKLITGFK